MTIITEWDDLSREYVAYDDDNYCGCHDCSPIHGYGDTRQAAIEDYHAQMIDSMVENIVRERGL